MTNSGSFTLYPFGGLGEIGMNCMAYKTEKSMALVDCGLMFPEDYHFGVDVVIPCFDFIIKNKQMLHGIVLTHGHEDILARCRGFCRTWMFLFMAVNSRSVWWRTSCVSMISISGPIFARCVRMTVS